MKKILLNMILAILLILLTLLTPWQALASPTVLINGRFLLLDVSPQIQNDRLLVPMSAIFQALNADVTWIQETQTIKGKKDNINITLQVGNTQADVNGQTVILDCPPVIVDGRTLVPLSFIAKSLGADVSWDGASETVSIVQKRTEVKPEKSNDLTVAQIAKKVNPSVVLIIGFDDKSVKVRLGSGVVVSSDGLILTNYHVVENCSSFEVTMLDGKKYRCESVLRTKRNHDLAVMKINANNLQAVEIGDSDELSVGDPIVTIGCPLGLERTVADGLVSAIRATDDKKYKAIQISAPVAPGSSGGALLNMHGQLVGVPFLSKSLLANLNFAVPINYAKDMIS